MTLTLPPLDLIDLSDHTPLLSNSEPNGINYSDPSIIPTTPSRPVPQVHCHQLTVRRRTRATTLRTTISDYRPPSFWPAPPDRVTLIDAVKYPAVLSRLLDYLAWHDFLAFGYTCRESMKLLRLPELKDVILSHFIPSYRHALRDRNFSRYKDVHVTYNDITLFLFSQQLPIGQYAKHAHYILLPSHSVQDRHRLHLRLIGYAVAHSRFVLLLQSLVHSSESPIDPEPTEPIWRSSLSHQSLRELIFPFPLAYTPEQPPAVVVKPKNTTSSNYKRTSSASVVATTFPRSRSAPTSQSPKGVRRRLSIFGSPPVLPPPPASEPKALRQYSGNWRRTSRCISTTSADEFSRSLRLPTRRFASSRVSSDSSLSFPSPITNGAGNASPLGRKSLSIHDVQMATVRSRAPILHVFVPCFELSEEVIAECEEQLNEAGLREHLSTGDLVYNLGHVQPIIPSDSDPFLEYLSELGERDLPPTSPKARQTWLLFNGFRLVPYTPPDAPPLDNALPLPSPWYYAHILPTYANPRFEFQTPACYSIPQLDFARTSTKIASPHSPTGYALVKRWVWMATVHRYREEPGMTTGWMGEWVMEAEGTMEGHRELLQCLRGKATRKEWEIVREKSGGGRIWLRLMNSSQPPKSSHHRILGLRRAP